MKKKSNLVTLLSLILLLALVVFLLFSWGGDAGTSDDGKESTQTENDSEFVPSTEDESSSEIGTPSTEDENFSEIETPSTEDINSSEIEKPSTESESTENESTGNTSTESESTKEPSVNKPSNNESASMVDALLIGDSRTVGLMEYAQIEDADFFCNVGMSVYNIHKEPVDVAGVGDVTLTELLEKKEYGKIYIMLGINEIGYNFKTTVSKYQALIELIQEKQPEANIIVEANLHVSQKRSDSDDIINNTRINELNAELAKLADNKKVFYIDANEIFDDADGALSAKKSGDGVHLYGKYYKEWGDWIAEETASLIGEN